MFSDTHFHLHHIWERGLDVPAALQSMAAYKPLFGLDIGTRCEDLFPRAQKCRILQMWTGLLFHPVVVCSLF